MYQSMQELIAQIDEPYRGSCEALIQDNRMLFRTSRGSSHNHQAWTGGYWDHVMESMNLAVSLYKQLDSLRPLSFTLSDALLVLFLHDLEKPWKNAVINPIKMQTKQDRKDFREKKIKEYKINLTEEQQNALDYVEGEGNDYTNKHRTQMPLAAFCHACDNLSARLWHDHPMIQNDPWEGSFRGKYANP